MTIINKWQQILIFLKIFFQKHSNYDADENFTKLFLKKPLMSIDSLNLNRRLSKIHSENSFQSKQNITSSSKIPRSLQSAKITKTKTIFTANDHDCKSAPPSIHSIVTTNESESIKYDSLNKDQQQLVEQPRVIENSALQQLTFVLSQLCDGNMTLNDNQLIDVVYLWSTKIKRGNICKIVHFDGFVFFFSFIQINTKKKFNFFRFISKIYQISFGLIVIIIFINVVNCNIFRYKCF